LKSNSFTTLYALLKGDLRARIGSLVLVFVLAAVTAFGQKAPILLLEPLFSRVLFRTEAAAQPAASAVGAMGSVKQQVLDRIFGPLDAPVDRMTALWNVALILITLALISAVAEYAFNWLSRRVALLMVLDLRQRLAKHLVGLSMRYHGERRFGDILSRVSNDVGATLESVMVLLKDCTQQPLLVVGSLGVAFVLAPLPTLVVIGLLPLIAIPISILGRKVRKRGRKSLATLGASVEVLTQIFTGIRTVKAFRAEERELARYRLINAEYFRAAMKKVRAMASIEAWTTLISNVGLAFLLLFVVWLNERFDLFQNPGQMGGFFVAISLVYGHVKRVTNSITKVQESAGAADRLREVLAEPVDIVQREGAQRIESLGKGLVFEQVSFTYPTGERPALEELTLQIRPGETLALVGHSGAGKTTLVDLIARFIDPSQGRVTADGRDLRDLTLDSWSGMYAMVGQVPFLFHASVLENIRYGKPRATMAEVEAAARAANIHDHIATLPQGYDTLVGDQGARLSGGQRQRITIARAILKGAPLLLLDEATSALDSESEAVVQEALDHLMQDRTVIVIAHRLTTIRNADRIAVLEQGRLVELGKHEELLARRGAYARLHEMQFKRSGPAAGAPAAGAWDVSEASL
jgi:ATP-binding cassette, subfamily B, bacterial MsbA